MPYFRAKKRCQYGGTVYDEGAVVEHFEPVSAQSWEPMDDEGKNLLMYPEEQPEEKDDAVQVSGTEFAELQGLYNAALADLEAERVDVANLKASLEEVEDALGVLKVENNNLAKAAEAATALQTQIAHLKKLVADNENKPVIEEAINNL
ncbi:hypothetical protein [Halodesulfovibrio sp.]|jgi:hypothetical protein|uniref:hypothetical protein n=1 Tax=Halodesulfovibrio sp. TaxID=1912772 RepID=UPI0025F6B065|nr:hypothetical protein [Halodesulfovibrio sp.]MCT4626974.1 hypothetical protein [Halodesulfovibrio sp.]